MRLSSSIVLLSSAFFSPVSAHGHDFIPDRFVCEKGETRRISRTGRGWVCEKCAENCDTCDTTDPGQCDPGACSNGYTNVSPELGPDSSPFERRLQGKYCAPCHDSGCRRCKDTGENSCLECEWAYTLTQEKGHRVCRKDGTLFFWFYILPAVIVLCLILILFALGLRICFRQLGWGRCRNRNNGSGNNGSNGSVPVGGAIGGYVNNDQELGETVAGMRESGREDAENSADWQMCGWICFALECVTLFCCNSRRNRYETD